MTDWATSGAVKVERAKEVVETLHAEIEIFLDSGAIYISSEIDDEGMLIRRWRILAKPASRWGALVGDVLNNLRSALNILWRTVLDPARAETDERMGDFPIRDSVADIAGLFRNLPEMVGQEKAAVELVLNEVKPYNGENELL